MALERALQSHIYIYIYIYNIVIKQGRKFLFNEALNTFYLQLYDVGHTVKDHPESQRGNLLQPLHGLFFFN